MRNYKKQTIWKNYSAKFIKLNYNKRVKKNYWIIKTKLEPLVHDTPNFALSFEYEDKKCIYVVDTANVDNIKAEHYDLYLIESNYNEELLEQHIQDSIQNNDSEDKLYYLNRVKDTHLSYTKCTDFLLENMGENSEFVRIHKSSYNYEGDD